MAVIPDRPDTGGEPELRPADPDRGYAITAGVLFVVATAASLASAPFLAPLEAPDLLLSTAAHGAELGAGVLLTLVAAAASAGIAVALYPVLSRYGPGLALGAVGFRVVEATMGFAGGVALLSLLALSREAVAAGTADEPSTRAAGRALLALWDQVGNVGLVAAFSIGGLLYYLVFYRARLVPRWLSAWGLLGVGLLLVAVGLQVFDLIGPMSAAQVVLALPILVQELVLAGWLIVRGFAQPRSR
jgi:uncharacterized protein DUF4386